MKFLCVLAVALAVSIINYACNVAKLFNRLHMKLARSKRSRKARVEWFNPSKYADVVANFNVLNSTTEQACSIKPRIQCLVVLDQQTLFFSA